MKRIIATLLAMLMLFAALASAESLEDYITEPVFGCHGCFQAGRDGHPLGCKPSVPAGATGNRVDQAE